MFNAILTWTHTHTSESEPPHKNFVFSLMWPNKEALLLQAASEKDRRCRPTALTTRSILCFVFIIDLAATQ